MANGKNEKLQQCVNQSQVGSSRMYMNGVRVLFVINPTRLTKCLRQPKIYTGAFLSIALNGIICCSKIGFQRSTKKNSEKHAHVRMQRPKIKRETQCHSHI